MSRGMPLRDNAIAAYLSSKAADAEDAAISSENFAVKAAEQFRLTFSVSPIDVTAIGPDKARINYEDMTFILVKDHSMNIKIYLRLCDSKCGYSYDNNSEEIFDLRSLGAALEHLPTCDNCPHCPKPAPQPSAGDALLDSLLNYIREERNG